MFCLVDYNLQQSKMSMNAVKPRILCVGNQVAGEVTVPLQ